METFFKTQVADIYEALVLCIIYVNYASTESPRTTLFKKRSRFTTTRRPVTKPSTTDIPDEPTIGSSILLTPEDKESSAIIINKNDQVVGSSIRQSTAHGNNISLVQKLALSRTENKYSNKGVTGINQVIPEDNLEADLSHEDHTEADIAIAVHNLAGAPLPTLQTYDEDNSEDDYIHTEKKSTTVTTTKRPTARRPQKTRISTTVAPQVTRPVVVRRRKPEPFSKISAVEVPHRTYRPIIDYDYYDDGEVRVVGRQPTHEKVLLHSSGTIECLDQGNFPHPASCKKFISCAKMENGGVVGWEYTCPKGLSYDPVGGICNWSAGLGCKD